MSAVNVLDVINQACYLLNDLNRERWGTPELVWWINDAQNAVVALAPSAGAVIKVITVSSDANADTRQYLPVAAAPDMGEEGISLIAVRRNMTSLTGVGKGAIRLVDRELLDSRSPTWNERVTDSTTFTAHLGYVYDPATPKSFFLWPMNNVTTYVEIEYVARPKVIDPPRYESADTTSAHKAIADSRWANDKAHGKEGGDGPNPVLLTVPNIYRESVLNYILFRAYSKDTEDGAPQRAQLYYQAFVTSVTGVVGGISKSAPDSNPSNMRFNPNTPSHYAK
jgi:hypothetical protein